ncbi:MAG: hypothetical protein JNL67_00735 [Planctomycetaceae bacterium]|nr:hypothetical protein [Planctomycetaceae bacterium]
MSDSRTETTTMLTEILDRWEVLRELQQQQATWQQRWDRAQMAFDEALRTIDARDADRLRRVLAETLTSFGKTTSSVHATNSANSVRSEIQTLPDDQPAPKAHATVLASATAPAHGGFPVANPEANLEPPSFQASMNANVAASSDQLAVTTISASDSPLPEPTPSEPEPVAAAPSIVVEEEYSLDELLTWATETIGDGMTENALFQELRKSKYSRQARQLFDSLKELDAFYETDDDVIRVQSLRALGL